MVAAVVLDNESRRWVVEISPPNESTVDIVKLRLDLRRRQAGSQQEPTKSRFHRRFSGRRVHGEGAQAPDTRPTAGQLRVADQSCIVSESQMNRRIDHNQRLDRREAQAKIAQGAIHSGRRQASDFDHIVLRDVTTPHVEAGT